jgi:pimeloyl-ACP methyl ester carboxylesterase
MTSRDGDGHIRPPSRAAAWREGLAALEPARLAWHGPRLALQPRGDGRAVIVLPGFGAGDASTVAIRGYLRTLRYDARGWGVGVNNGDVELFVRAMVRTVDRLHAATGRRVPLVGWSLGGVIAREVARGHPDLVEQVITFGSPIKGGPKYTRVGAAFRSRGIDVDAVEARIAERNRIPIRVPVTAIYTKGDGVVAWQACIDDVTPGARNIEVRTTHIGLGMHHRVFVEVARALNEQRTTGEASVSASSR